MRNLRDKRCQLRVNNPDAISIDVLESVQSQYAASPRILGLLIRKAALLDPGRDVMLWYDGIFNPQTAVGIGLDIWTRIVGGFRSVNVPQSDKCLGFSGSLLLPMNHGVFWKGAESYEPILLDTRTARRFLFWKAAVNIGSAEAAEINRLLALLFPGKTLYAIERGVMHLRVVSEFALSPVEEAFFLQYGLPGHGAGVGVSWLAVALPVFGMANSGLSPFDQAPLYSGRVIGGQYTPVELPALGFSGSGLSCFGEAPFWSNHIFQQPSA